MSMAVVQYVFPSLEGTRRAESDLRWRFRSDIEAKDFRVRISLILPKGSRAFPESDGTIKGTLFIVRVHATGGTGQLDEIVQRIDELFAKKDETS